MWPAACLALLLLAPPPPSPPPGPPPAAPAGPALADAPRLERQTLESLLGSTAWTRRAVAVLRLERFACPETAEMLRARLDDPAWQVRAFAARTLGRRRVALPDDGFADEHEPRVLRAALRARYPIGPERLGRGVRYLARSGDLEQMMLAVELGAASGDDDLRELARATARKVILRMGRTDAGTLSPRLAAVTGQRDLRRHTLWKQWLMKTGRGFEVRAAWATPSDDQGLPPPSALARLDAEAFSDLEQYIEKLATRRLDLAICLDCTASMWGELAAAQGGIDDLMLFLRDVVGRVRIGLVAYRDRRDDFETKGWSFTDDVAEARGRLWQLTAEGGGDSPEAVFPALRMALAQLDWSPEHTKVLVLVGDAPPHVGFGAQCVDLVRQAAARGGLTTHVIQCVKDDRAVPHFPEIAEAGGGRCLNLDDDDALVAEIAGLTLGGAFEDEFRAFFDIYLELCR